MNQSEYIIGILNNINIHTVLLELMDWDEQAVESLLILVSNTINNKNTVSLINDISLSMKQNGYDDIVVNFICEYLNSIVIKKEISYDC